MKKAAQTILFTTLTLLVVVAHTAFAAEVDYEKIYKKQCATCHGNKGDGKGRAGASFAVAPTDFTSSASKQLLTPARITAAIRDGVAGTPMVAYGRRFDEEMLKGLTEFIQTAFMSRVLYSVNDKSSRGQDIYNDNCSACHGDKGQSAVWAQNGLNPPPRNFTTAESRDELSRERMVTSVTYGRPGTAMMSFAKRLSSADIKAVVGYIRQNFMQKPQASSPPSGHGVALMAPMQASTPASTPVPAPVERAAPSPNQSHEIKVDMQAVFPDGWIGKAVSGKVFYDSNCFTCHGKKGDGKGPRADFNYPRPRNFTSDDSRLVFNRPRLFRSISHGKRGSVMPAWKTVLTQQQIADVGEYVFQQFIMNNHVVIAKKKISTPLMK